MVLKGRQPRQQRLGTENDEKEILTLGAIMGREDSMERPIV